MFLVGILLFFYYHEGNRIGVSILRFFRIVLLRLPALLIAAFIWYLSSQSTLPQPEGVLGWDKLQHVLAYAVLGAAIGLWASPAFWKRRPVLAMLLTSLAGSTYGVIDEIHQYFVQGRNSSIWDVVADALGAFLGALAMMLFMRGTCKTPVLQVQPLKNAVLQAKSRKTARASAKLTEFCKRLRSNMT